MTLMVRRSLSLFSLAFVLGACLPGAADTGKDHAGRRAVMVRKQIEARGVSDVRVLKAMGKVKRHLFVPTRYRSFSYSDRPLPIGLRQTISQPYIVGFMTEALKLKPGARVLEIGTGSGYQAAILGYLAKEVYSVEIIPQLGRRAKKLLGSLGYSNVHVRIGDGYKGWPDKAPFDAIILTAAPPSIPQPLIQQLKKTGGVLVAPVGPSSDQRLVRLTRSPKGVHKEQLMFVRFVPMTGKAQGKK